MSPSRSSPCVPRRGGTRRVVERAQLGRPPPAGSPRLVSSFWPNDRGREAGGFHVLDVHADRPPIPTPLVDDVRAVDLNGGASYRALLDAVTGPAEPRGRPPFDLPRSMAAIEAPRPDVPIDTAEPLFRFGLWLEVRWPVPPAGSLHPRLNHSIHTAPKE